MIYEITTTGSEATQNVARRLASMLHGGEIIELVSDLGGGKTTFVQGLAVGLGYTGVVTSPTFALSHIYELPSGLELHHYDLYRLGEGGVVGYELLEDTSNPRVITAIEWAEIMSDELPSDRLTVTFAIKAKTERHLSFASSGPESDRLIAGIAA